MRGYRSTFNQPPPYPDRYRAPASDAGSPTCRRRESTHSRAVFARGSNRATMHASSAVRRPRSAGAPHVPLTALRGPPSGTPARPPGILGTVPTLAAGIRRVSPPHPEGPPSIRRMVPAPASGIRRAAEPVDGLGGLLRGQGRILIARIQVRVRDRRPRTYISCKPN